MNRKHVNSDMDSGLGSDDDRSRSSRTKEQKQLHNQQLLSGCFIDAATLSDDSEVATSVVVDQRRNDERRQGSLIFQSSIPQFSMLQISNNSNNTDDEQTSSMLFTNPTSTTTRLNYPAETTTPFNSIVQLATITNDADEEDNTDVEQELAGRNKSPLGFYVDLSQVPEPPLKTPISSSSSSIGTGTTAATKNIFSMVIDFEGPKKEKPIKLSSSYSSSCQRKLKPKSNSLLLLNSKCNGSSGISTGGGASGASLSSSISSINSITNLASTSRQSEEQEIKRIPKNNYHHHQEISQSNMGMLASASLVKKLSISTKSKSSSDEINTIETTEDEPEIVDESNNDQENVQIKEETMIGINNEIKGISNNDNQHPVSLLAVENDDDDDKVLLNNNDSQRCEEIDVEALSPPPPPQPLPAKEIKVACPQFVKLSDIECPKPKVDIDFTPRMSRSIPESHWTENSYLMSHSACYRSAPRPIESDRNIIETNSDSDSITTNSCASQPKKAVRRLGTDLLRMFLEEIGPDVIVEVNGHKFKAHKCILASRCQYFAALLSGRWLEKSGNIISLQGFSYEAVYFALCHIYSGAAHVPDSISLVELASLADMLGLEGLKEVVEYSLKQRHCHNFHKPCAGCCTGVLEVLPLAAAYGLDDLYQKCLQWITQHFVRMWPSRGFASLPRELREKCYQQHVVHMNPDKVLETIIACDKILITLPAMRWAEPVSQLVVQLSDACHLYHRQHFAAVLACSWFHSLDVGLGFGVCQVEDQMLNAAKNLGIDQACRSYAQCCKMLNSHWSRPFADLLNKIKIQLEQCLVNQADKLIRSNAWLRLDTILRTRIKELTPSAEPQSRLPRASLLKNKKITNHSPILSSSDSSRNSSPGMNQNNLPPGGSPSLRRSLLLAAKAPQVPPSPSIHRRSTLTQPTAASTARSVSSNASRQQKSVFPISNRPPPRTAANANIRPSSGGSIRSKPTTNTNVNSRPNSAHASMSSSYTNQKSLPNSKKTSTIVSRNASLGKKDTTITAVSNKKVNSNPNSPLKSNSRINSPRKIDSRLTSPVKTFQRSSSPLKRSVSAATTKPPQSPRRLKSNNNNGAKSTQSLQQQQQQPTLQRSSTFLKDEPTVLGKVI